MTPFDFVKSVSETKKDLSGDEEFKSYSPWIVNKALAGSSDCVLLVNEINTRQVEPLHQYQYYLNIIPPRQRWSKWLKKENGSDVEVVRKYLKCSVQKAKQALELLSSEQIEQIRKLVEDVK